VAACQKQEVWWPPHRSINGGRWQAASKRHLRRPPVWFNTCGGRFRTPGRAADVTQQHVWLPPRGSNKDGDRCAAPQQRVRWPPVTNNMYGGRRTAPPRAAASGPRQNYACDGRRSAETRAALAAQHQ